MRKAFLCALLVVDSALVTLVVSELLHDRVARPPQLEVAKTTPSRPPAPIPHPVRAPMATASISDRDAAAAVDDAHDVALERVSERIAAAESRGTWTAVDRAIVFAELDALSDDEVRAQMSRVGKAIESGRMRPQWLSTDGRNQP